jgi:hypothetical protein
MPKEGVSRREYRTKMAVGRDMGVLLSIKTENSSITVMERWLRAGE